MTVRNPTRRWSASRRARSTRWRTLSVCSVCGAGVQLSAWAAIPDALKAFVLIRPQGAGGNGSTSPAFTGMGLAVRV